MKLVLSFFALAFVLVECKHVFLGTNVERPLVFHQELKYSANTFTKRIETFSYTLPKIPNEVTPRYIQGILAYDLNNTEASLNVTEGGIGANFVKLRIKSERRHPIHYDLYIYA